MVQGMSGKELSWRTGYSLTRKPAKKSRPRRTRRILSDGTTSFEFVEVQPRKSCMTHDSKPRSPKTECTSTPTISYELNDVGTSPGSAASINSNRGLDGTSSLSSVVPSSITRANDESLQIPRSRTCTLNDCDATAEEPEPATCDLLVATQTATFSNVSDITLPKAVEYGSLFDRLLPVLQRYEFEFCKIPLTTELEQNPFNCRATLSPQRTFLLHAVLALAGQHVQSSDIQTHRFTALHAFRKRLDNLDSIVKDLSSLLDTIVILFSLDETQSHFGNWRTHLLGALSLLEAAGGPSALALSPKIQVQVALLTWWDAIVSLVSRDAPVFPYTYFEAASSNHDSNGWSYFGLCGCPLELVEAVMQLAHYHSQKPAYSHHHQIPHLSDIARIESHLASWTHEPPDDNDSPFDEECVQRDQDKMHCSEAWRHGLLLYIYRVFKWKPGDGVPIRILYRARTIVDHVFACRDDGMVARQALLPLFFAGCELQDQPLRQRILDFCTIWDFRTRYQMFRDTIPLLQETWAAQKTHGLDNVWWGQIVDEKHRSSANHLLPKQICFG